MLMKLTRFTQVDLQYHDLCARLANAVASSSFTNFEPEAAVALLRNFVHVAALGPGDCILIGIDSCQDQERLAAAYGSQSTHWRKYAQNGIRNAGKILGGSAALALQDARDWEYIARWDNLRKRHIRFVKASKALAFEIPSSYSPELKETIKIARGEHIFLSQSYKYSRAELRLLFRDAGLAVTNEWQNERDDGAVYLLQKAC
ncbi:uncharacterized protein MYCFIDRAFT_85179 [Pseudocercospora fijiensis CIRAD86]|uniref:Histidine-specific methyltransferase SAM-dependent domain-containing protein n=1 Tax=Pseudocercospora fijiensis (strain CIRAD86) TaxID=383855 RepID=M2YT24_PSEFD|nr:uncharacterized protein MYCFIDRAFT_85179 [Pseudocercospora fijiensis CIRAD86]EME80875.1 hypothetical protein MYCFIDRAFT_85179 [Pseudocercospora fijiensis CIRAD86]